MAYIYYTEKNVQKSYQLPENRMLVFGREEYSDFQILDDSLISREHFGIEKDENGDYVVMDLGSSNGTFLNEKTIGANVIVKLNDGDKIRAGRQSFIFKLTKIPAGTSGGGISEVIREMNTGKGYHTILSEIVNKEKTKKLK